MAKDRSKKDTVKPAYFDNPLRMFKPGLAALRVNSRTIIWLVLAPFIASLPFFFLIVVVAAYFGGQRGSSIWATIIFTAVSLALYASMLVLGVFVTFGLTLATLRSADGEKLSFWSVFKIGRHYFWRFAGLMLALVLIVAAGFVLLVVPGVILLRRYFLAPFYLVDKDLGVFDAMRRSADETRQTGGVWSLLAAVLVLSLPAAIPGIGWLISLALTILYICVPAIRYREIQQVLAGRAKRAAAESEAAAALSVTAPPAAKKSAPATASKAQPKAAKHTPPGRKKPSRRARRAGRTTNQ